ncbi:hypothetical protein HanIR_Chr10g0451261 [Helianthus annuus]|nr:hypothetical protein HanIR_Chr10g0451261 [Helianthus annuus]
MYRMCFGLNVFLIVQNGCGCKDTQNTNYEGEICNHRALDGAVHTRKSLI